MADIAGCYTIPAMHAVQSNPPSRPASPWRQARTVGQVAADARRLVEQRFPLVWIEGEVSNFRPYASGHWYFSLKDDRAQLRCVMFSNRNRLVRDRIADGLSVLVRGRLSIYEPRGDFQAIIDHIEPAGEGALRAAFERLKARLAGEGLFAEERKRALPTFPGRIAVISSRSGAALRDVLAVIRRRFPCVQVTCLHTPVQGAEAEGGLLAAFDRMVRLDPLPDVVIVARGGGSLEDLAAFNRESVARRIAASTVPVVSAIGHETDFTIADFVADRRAPTPSAAAELATPDGSELLARLARLEAAITSRLAAQVRTHQRLLVAVRRRLVHPGRALEQRMQRTDELADRLAGAMRATLRQAQTALTHQRQLLDRANPFADIQLAKALVARAQTRLDSAALSFHEAASVRLGSLARALAAVSPLATLERGYAIVARPDGSRWGKPLASIADAAAGDAIVAHLADGKLHARVEDATASRVPRGSASPESSTGGRTSPTGTRQAGSMEDD